MSDTNAPADSEPYFVGAASGGPTAATTMVALLLDTMILGQTLDQVMPAKRLHHGGAPDVVIHEEGIDPAILASLTKRGHQVAPAGIIGRLGHPAHLQQRR